MNVLVAGFGDLGQRIWQRLCATPEVTAIGLARTTPAATIKADLSDRASLPDLSDFDRAVLCVTPDQRDREHYEQTYLVAAKNLAAALPPSSPIVFVSSTAVYGQDDGQWVDESAVTRPTGFNGEVLLAAERVVRAHGGCVVRLAGLYETSQRWRRLASVATPPLSARWTNRIHRDDAAALVTRLTTLAEPPAVVNGSDDRPLRAGDIINRLRQQAGASILALDSPDCGKRISNRLLHTLDVKLAHPELNLKT